MPSTRTVAENLKRYRKDSGRSMRALAEEMTAAGWPITHTVVSQIENGTRRIDVDDLSRFAHVLHVPVIALLLPATDKPDQVVGTSVDPNDTSEIAVWRIFGDIPGAPEWLTESVDAASGTLVRNQAAGIEALENALELFDPMDVDNAALLARGALNKKHAEVQHRRDQILSGGTNSNHG